MRLVIAVVCAWSIHVSNAQTNFPSQRPPSPEQLKPDARQSQQKLLAQTLEYGMLSVRPIPDLPVLEFDDPLQQEDQKRFDVLYREFSASVQAKWILPDPKDSQYASQYASLMKNFARNLNMELPKFFQDRANAAAVQYGTADPRFIAALEDAGIALAGPRS